MAGRRCILLLLLLRPPLPLSPPPPPALPPPPAAAAATPAVLRTSLCGAGSQDEKRWPRKLGTVVMTMLLIDRGFASFS